MNYRAIESFKSLSYWKSLDLLKDLLKVYHIGNHWISRYFIVYSDACSYIDHYYGHHIILFTIYSNTIDIIDHSTTIIDLSTSIIDHSIDILSFIRVANLGTIQVSIFYRLFSSPSSFAV